MAEALKTFFSPALVRRIGASLGEADSSFPVAAFVETATRGLDEKELLDRGRHVAAAMRRHLPERYEDAMAVLLRSLGPPHATDELEGVGMGPFFYLPHVLFVGAHGLDHFELSMAAQHALTQRFTCEWSIRPFLARHRDATLARLAIWARDPSPHVRRLVSEGTRLRLPWAGRLPELEAQPERIVALLELLRDDPTSVVRRSVANNLNDLGRVDPDRLLAVCERWFSEARRDVVEHALRGRVKAGDRRALALLGFGRAAEVSIEAPRFSPRRVRIGGAVTLSFRVTNTTRRPVALLVDVTVYFVKASGKARPKVFKIARVELGPGESRALQKRFSLDVHTTRKPYPGKHEVELRINGAPYPIGAFVVSA